MKQKVSSASLVHIIPILTVTVLTLVAAQSGLLHFANLRQVTKSQAATLDLADIDVTYVERTPRYNRYDVTYVNNVPQLRAGTENDQHWPNVGEPIHYIAHMQNKGHVAAGTYNYQWKVNNTVVASGTVTDLQPGQETTVQYDTTWTDAAQKIEFVADSENAIEENSKANNNRAFGSRDLAFEIFVEKGLYDIFSNSANLVSTYSFEDWVQAHFEKMQERFGQAVYPTSPQGILEKIRIDKIIVADELDSSTSPLNADADNLKYDGRWQFTDGDPTNAQGLGGAWQTYFNDHATSIDWGLNHELTHQLGIIDLYQFNLNNDPADNNGVHVLDANGQQVPVSSLPTYQYDQVLFQHQGLMGGGETAPYNDVTYYESHTAAGLNRHTGMRRGYYGEYLFDTPTNTSLKLYYSNGEPIENANVSLYQKDLNGKIDNTAEFSGSTDTLGLVALANRSVIGTTTETGHTLRANPFGQINVVGTNGTMLVKVTKNGQTGYGWFLLHDLNLEYWKGNTASATVQVKTNLSIPLDPANRALNKTVTSNRTEVISGHELSRITDGDTTTPDAGWTIPNPIRVGDYVQMDLGSTYPVSRVVIYPSVQNYGDMCNKLHIDVSSTGSFNGEQTRVVTETARIAAQKNVYDFVTTNGRYVRMTCDEEKNWVQIEEMEVYGPTVVSTPTPTPTVPPTASPSPTPTRSPSPTPTRSPSPTPTRTPAPTLPPRPTVPPKFNLTIRANGTAAKNSSGAMEFPFFYVKLDGVRVKNSAGIDQKFGVTASLKDYTYSTTGTYSKVEIEYINDAETDRANDRNLRVDYIQVNGKTYQTESPSVYESGAWKNNACSAGNFSTEWLYCNGFFRYTL